MICKNTASCRFYNDLVHGYACRSPKRKPIEANSRPPHIHRSRPDCGSVSEIAPAAVAPGGRCRNAIARFRPLSAPAHSQGFCPVSRPAAPAAAHRRAWSHRDAIRQGDDLQTGSASPVSIGVRTCRRSVRQLFDLLDLRRSRLNAEQNPLARRSKSTKNRGVGFLPKCSGPFTVPSWLYRRDLNVFPAGSVQCDPGLKCAGQTSMIPRSRMATPGGSVCLTKPSHTPASLLNLRQVV